MAVVGQLSRTGLQDRCTVIYILDWLGRVAKSVTCMTADTCLTADPGVKSLIPILSHTFLEIDH